MSLIGILLDVSGSMKQSIGSGTDEPDTTQWIESIFKVLDGLIKHDISDSNHVFAFGVGAEKQPHVFDILSTLEHFTARKTLDIFSILEMPCVNGDSPAFNPTQMQKEELLQNILSLLEQRGAPNIRKWARWNVLCSLVDKRKADIFWNMLISSDDFVKEFVAILPEECRSFGSIMRQTGFLLATALDGTGIQEGRQDSLVRDEMENVIETGLHMAMIDQSLAILQEFGSRSVRYWGRMKTLLEEIDIQKAIIFLYMLKTNVEFRLEAVKESVKTTVTEAIELVNTCLLTQITEESIKSVHQTTDMLRGSIQQDEITRERAKELLKVVDPFIYGGTPLIEAMEKARYLFFVQKYREHRKVLFVLSDGQPADGNNPPLQELSDLGVTIISCFITHENLSQPKQLFSKKDAMWSIPMQFMFDISSTIITQTLPYTILMKKGWHIQADNNETRLFIQANHPDIINEAIDLAQNIACGQDALVDLLATVSLDLYINKACEGFGAKRQIGGTCYANAAAAVMHLSMKRIINRHEGYPDFIDLRDEMIRIYGMDGAVISNVLTRICPKYRLHFQKTDICGALKAITAKRPVLVIFSLSRVKWELFSEFYDANPSGILTKADLEKRTSCTNPQSTAGGHAVVLTSFNKDCLILMNSWGDDWANSGFFNVQNADVLNLKFYDIYWTLGDLHDNEKQAYERYGKQEMKKLFDRLKGLKNSMYRCPKCHRESKVCKFTGGLLSVICPQCRERFDIHEAGDDLALNMYLTSRSG